MFEKNFDNLLGKAKKIGNTTINEAKKYNNKLKLQREIENRKKELDNLCYNYGLVKAFEEAQKRKLERSCDESSVIEKIKSNLSKLIKFDDEIDLDKMADVTFDKIVEVFDDMEDLQHILEKTEEENEDKEYSEYKEKCKKMYEGGKIDLDTLLELLKK